MSTPPGVRARDMNGNLAALYASSDPTVGLFGPDTMLWKVARESAIVLGGGRAALLQLAHPYIAHAIAQHSSVLHDIRGRFQRTLSVMFAMTFGDRAEAIRWARSIYAQHKTIRGTLHCAEGNYPMGQTYSALNIEAMFWVAATLWDTSILVYEALIGPLTELEKEAYYQDTKRFCALFGLPPDELPATWIDFRQYFERMCVSEQLHVGAEARRLSTEIFKPNHVALAPLYGWIKLMTAASLPNRLREAYGLRYGSRERLAHAVGTRAVQKAWTRLPEGLRFCPEYLNARLRLDGRPGIHRSSDVFKRIFLYLMGPT